MNTELRIFIARWLGVVAATLVPVVVIAFISMPLSMNRHPGELALHDGSPAQHMS